MLSIKLQNKTLLFLLCLLALLAVTGCASRPIHFGVIFTVNDSDGPIDIYRIPDNTQNQVEQLTFTPMIGEYGLLVSPKGDRIVFNTERYASLEMEPSELAIEELRHIYHLNTVSKELTDITNVLEDKYAQVGPDFFMDWAPDQKQFVVITHKGGGYEIESFLEFVDFDGKNRKDIHILITSEVPSLIQTAKWSPDGKKFLLTQGAIGFEQQRQYPGSAILIYDLEGGEVKQITNYEAGCLPISWSPTSQQIVATCSYVPLYGAEGVSRSEFVRIFDVENPGQSYERVDFSPCYDPSWSPDGKQIVFVCDKGGDQKGLFTINSDGNGIREVKIRDLETTAILKDPTWSPDGRQIVYVNGSDYEHTNIYSIYPDGSNNQLLTNQEAFYSIAAVYPIP